MESLEKIKAFEEALSFIKDDTIREFAKEAITFLPDYFFVIPASSTGKYHPAYSLGEGGLLRHTLSAVRIAMELYRAELWAFTPEERDLMLVALMLHDGWKSGVVQGQYTLTEHPKIAVQVLEENEKLKGMLPEKSFYLIQHCIITHMGRWTKDFKTGAEVLDKPSTPFQRFVHLADYLASRKCLLMDFTVPISPD